MDIRGYRRMDILRREKSHETIRANTLETYAGSLADSPGNAPA